MKKAICFIMAITLLLGLVSCKKAEQGSSQSAVLPSQTDNGQEKTINLLYTYSDSFNPYTATTSANRELGSLLYDPLVKTDNNFEPQNILAQTVTNEGTTCTVKLKNAAFTDGSTVTANDVIYSYNLAKECVRFSGNFYEVAAVSSPDSQTVVFALSQNDPFFANLLDFPIVKADTAGVTNADGKEIAPIGCGRYRLTDDGTRLLLNTKYHGKKGVIKTIDLINSPDATSTSHYVEIGAANIYYTDSSDIVRMSGKKTQVNLNRLVYIGINQSYGPLQSKEMRYALSSALDRDSICRTAYYNNAIAASGYFNPSFEPADAVQTIESKPNFKITVENLAKIGYNNTNANGFYSNSAGVNPTFTLLVNGENASRVAAANMIAAQCKAAGIQLSVATCTYEQYVQRLISGQFQLYLGEVQVLDNMDFSNLVISGGSAAYGVDKASAETATPQDDTAATPQDAQPQVPQSSGCDSIISAYHKGECGIGDVASTLLAEMPQIPLCYLNGSLFYDSVIKGGIESSSSDIYLSIQNYEF